MKNAFCFYCFVDVAMQRQFVYEKEFCCDPVFQQKLRNFERMIAAIEANAAKWTDAKLKCRVLYQWAELTEVFHQDPWADARGVPDYEWKKRVHDLLAKMN